MINKLDNIDIVFINSKQDNENEKRFYFYEPSSLGVTMSCFKPGKEKLYSSEMSWEILKS